MSQIRTGTASVTNGSNNVIASADNDWSQAEPNCLFSIPSTSGSSVLYTVATVEGPGVSASGKWELFLTANYAGDTAADVAYMIHKDFTPTLGLPIIQYGDTDTAILVNRAVQLLEAAISGLTVTASGVAYIGEFDDFVGGTSDDADSLPTVDLPTGKPYLMKHTTYGAVILFLNAGTDATSGTTPPGKFRPTDFNAVTNQKFWSTGL